MTSNHPAQLQVLWRWASGVAAGADTLEAVSHEPAHRRPRACGRSLLDSVKQRWSSAAPWVTEQPSLGSLCSPPWPEEGARKGALNIACFTTPWPAHRGWRGSHSCGRKLQKTKVKALNLGTWNVRTLLDNTKADRPERRTALVARELARYNVDIAALSETRFADKGQLTERGGGYTFFWSGRSSTERREAGVGFAIRSHLARNLVKLPEGINDRLMTLQIPLGNKKSATLISAYAPTMTNPDDIKDKFYEELDSLITAVPQSEKLIILGDFNARVGTDSQTWEGIIGRHGTGKCNSNGLLLLKTCATHDLVITTHCSAFPPVTRPLGCTHAPGTGI